MYLIDVLHFVYEEVLVKVTVLAFLNSSTLHRFFVVVVESQKVYPKIITAQKNLSQYRNSKIKQSVSLHNKRTVKRKEPTLHFYIKILIRTSKG